MHSSNPQIIVQGRVVFGYGLGSLALLLCGYLSHKTGEIYRVGKSQKKTKTFLSF